MGRGRHALRPDGLLGQRLRAEGHRHPLRLPHYSAGGCRCDRSCGRGCGRVVDGDLDGRLDGSPDSVRALPGEGLSRRPRPGQPGPVHRAHRLRHRPVRRGLDRELDIVDHRQRLRLQGAQGAAPRGHADPLALHQDLPGASARDRDGARVPRQVRASADRRHDEAQARAVGEELRARGVRGAARRARLHEGRREHQLAALHAVARQVPLLAGGGQPRRRPDGRDQGSLHERDRRDHGGDVRARGVREGDRLADHHDGPDRRLHGDVVDVEVGARERGAIAPAPGGPRHLHPAEDPRRLVPGDREVVPDARGRPHPRGHGRRQARRRPRHDPRLLRRAAPEPQRREPRDRASTSTRTGARCPP